MGREVRRVPANWEHPKKDGRLVPLLDGYWKVKEHFDQMEDEHGIEHAIDYTGHIPTPEMYMPDWDPELRTHYQMYENITEGTPISPPMATPEDLARWLADNKAPAFGHEPADYDHWMETIRLGQAPTGRFSLPIDDGNTQDSERSPPAPV